MRINFANIEGEKKAFDQLLGNDDKTDKSIKTDSFRGLLSNWIDKMSSISLDVREFDGSNEKSLGVDSKLLNITTVLKSKDFVVDEINTNTETEALAICLRNEKTRIALNSILTNVTVIEEVISLCIASRNGAARLESPITDLVLIFRAIDDSKLLKTMNLSKYTKFAIAMLLQKFFSVQNLLATQVDMVSVSPWMIVDNMEKSFKRDIQDQIIKESCARIYFRNITKLGKNSTCAALASAFVHDLNPFRGDLINITRRDKAFDNILPRIKSYILNTLHKNYEPHELEFKDRADFQFLATNLDFVMAALKSDTERSNIPAYYWSEYDSILAQAVRNSQHYSVVSLAEYSKYFSLNKLYDNRGKLRYVTLTKNIKSDININSFWVTTSMNYVEVNNYNYADSALVPVTKWINSIDSRHTHFEIDKLLSAVMESVPVVSLVTCFVDKEELVKYSMAIAGELFLGTSSDGEPIITYGIHSATAPDLTKLPIGVRTDYFTSDVIEHVILQSQVNLDSLSEKNSLVLREITKLQEGRKYYAVGLPLSNTIEKKNDLRLYFKKSITDPAVLVNIPNKSLAEILDLDLGYSIQTTSVYVALPLSQALISLNVTLPLLLDHELGKIVNYLKADYINLHGIQESEQPSNEEFLLIAKKSREDFQKIWQCRLVASVIDRLITEPSLRSIFSKIGSIVKSMLNSDRSGRQTKFKREIDSGALHMNNLYKEQIAFAVAIYLLRAVGVLNDMNGSVLEFFRSDNDWLDSDTTMELVDHLSGLTKQLEKEWSNSAKSSQLISDDISMADILGTAFLRYSIYYRK